MDINYRRSKKQPLVFIGTPTSNVKDYCWDLFYERVKSLTYPNKVFWIADNSKDSSHAANLRKLGIQVIRVKPKAKTNIQYLCESHNALRDIFLASKAKIFLHLESDIIPPQDVIERLIIANKPVVSAQYFIDFGAKSHSMMIVAEEKSDKTLHTTRLDKGSDFHLINGKLRQVLNGGLGCTMIHRSVIEQIPFRYDKNHNAHPDTFFSIDLKDRGIPFFVDTDIQCEHHNSEWTHF